MTAVPQSTALLVLAVLGGLAQFALALRFYEPPPPDEGEPPLPVIEAALFFVVFALFYGVVGVALSALVEVLPPYGGVGVLLVGLVGLYPAYATYAGTFDGGDSRAARTMGVATGVTASVIAAVVLVL